MQVKKLISPFDQPSKIKSLRDTIQNTLSDVNNYDKLIITVAYAKFGILNELQNSFEKWKQNGNQLIALVGIDQKITSKEALEFLVDNFNSTKIINHKLTTFHPKVFLFKGELTARVIIGSNNLTFGGMDNNFESAAVIDFDLKCREDLNVFTEFEDGIKSLTEPENGISLDVDKEVISLLEKHDLLAIETKIPGIPSQSAEHFRRHDILNDLFSSSMKVVRRKKTIKTQKQAQAQAQEVYYESFYIQITPHHNGEVFLSKKAVNEYPEFFGFPFTGKTTPKNGSTKPPYPQRTPDPIVNIRVFGKNNQEILKLESYNLNTVFYEPKKEIRITCSPLVQLVPEYSLLIMSKLHSSASLDYEMVIHTPESPYYENNLAHCTKSMPTGGSVYKEGPNKGMKKAARRYGWVTSKPD